MFCPSFVTNQGLFDDNEVVDELFSTETWQYPIRYGYSLVGIVDMVGGALLANTKTVQLSITLSILLEELVRIMLTC